jgi:hypothetical protein
MTDHDADEESTNDFSGSSFDTSSNLDSDSDSETESFEEKLALAKKECNRKRRLDSIPPRLDSVAKSSAQVPIPVCEPVSEQEANHYTILGSWELDSEEFDSDSDSNESIRHPPSMTSTTASSVMASNTVVSILPPESEPGPSMWNRKGRRMRRKNGEKVVRNPVSSPSVWTRQTIQEEWSRLKVHPARSTTNEADTNDPSSRVGSKAVHVPEG